MRSYLIFLLIFSTIPAIFFKPHVGILIWSWVSYMNPHRLTWGFAYNFSFLVFVAAATIISAFMAKEPKRLPNHPLIWLLFIYFFWTTLTTIFSAYPEMAWIKWERVAKTFLFTIMTVMFMQSRGRLHALLWVIVLSMGYFAMKGGLFTVISAGAHRVWGPPATFFADNNHFALAMCMILPLVRYLQLHTENKYVRWFMAAMLFFGFFSIFGTHSRGALVGITAMVIFLVWKSRRIMFGLGVLVVVVGIGYWFMPQSWHDRMATITEYETDASATGRLDMWKFAIDVANDAPVLGGGYDIFYHEGYRAAYLPEGVTGRAAHSIWFEVLGEHGYVGLLLFLLLGITTYFTCGAIIQRCRNHPDLKWAQDFAAMLQVGIVGFATAGTFLNVATFDLYYHMVVMAVIIRVLVDRRLAEKAAETTPAETPPITGFKPAIAPRGGYG